MPASEDDRKLLKAEHLVEVKEAELKKELRLGDLALSQILYIAGVSWLGPAAKLGPSQIMSSAFRINSDCAFSTWPRVSSR